MRWVADLLISRLAVSRVEGGLGGGCLPRANTKASVWRSEWADGVLSELPVTRLNYEDTAQSRQFFHVQTNHGYLATLFWI